MLQKLNLFTVCCLALVLMGCAGPQPKLIHPPVNVSDIKPISAKKIFFYFDVSLESNYRNNWRDVAVEHWTQLGNHLVEKIKGSGVNADFKIKFEKSGLPGQPPQDATHILLFTQESATLSSTIIVDYTWNTAVLQKMPSSDVNRINYKQLSVYKYRYDNFDCFLKMRSDEFKKTCFDAHSNFQIEQLKRMGIIN